ncbi:MAG: hypothetical protein ABL883_00885 [Terricaulis sp.]
MITTRKSVGALMLYLSAQAAAGFAPEAAANEQRQGVGAREAVAPAPVRLVLADPSWDAFVFVSAATAIALELSAPVEHVAASEEGAFAYQAAEPQFDYLAALTDVGIAQPVDAPNPEHHWLG